MWILPHERVAATYHAWLARHLSPGEPLWHVAVAERSESLGIGKLWGALTGAAREARERGVFRSLAEITVVAAVDALVDHPEATMADVVWREAPGWSKPAVDALAVGLTPQRLMLLSIARSTHDPSFERAYAPAALVSLAPEQITPERLRMRAKTFVKAEWIELELGPVGDAETFSFHGDDHNRAQTRAILERLAALG